MEICNEWEELNKRIFSTEDLNNEVIMNAITSESKLAIHQIKKRLKIKSFWAVGFITLFSTLMFLLREIPEVVIAIGIVNLIYIIGLITLIFMAKKINTNFLGDDSVLQNIQLNARMIKQALTFEELFFTFTTPLIVLCSMFGTSLKRGNTLSTLLHDSQFLTVAIIVCLISVPFTYLSGKYLNRKAFGNHLEKLKNNIKKLNDVNLIKDTDS